MTSYTKSCNQREIQGRGAFPILMISALSLSTGGCLEADDLQLLQDVFDADVPTEPQDVPAPDLEPQCFNNRFIQPEAEVTKKLDLLFVTDTSGSLNSEREGIANGIDSFVAELPVDVDFRVGVMLAHGPTSDYASSLFQTNDGEPTVLDSEQLSMTQIRDMLREKLMDPPGDSDTDGGELGLHSLAHALEGDNLTAIQNEGFFRNDAALAVVFVADENDICAIYPDGVTPVYDPNEKEPAAFANYCAGQVYHEMVVNRLQALKGEQPLVVAGIVYNNVDTVPSGGENEVGYGYLDAIALANGLDVDLANGDYDEGLSEIGTLTSIKLTLITDVTLSHPDVDANTIEVFVDGIGSDFSYMSATNTVTLLEPGGPLSVVDVNYCLMSSGGDPGDGGNDPPDGGDDPPDDGGGGIGV